MKDMYEQPQTTIVEMELQGVIAVSGGGFGEDEA